tara:strand:+ start:110 stop:397 length:288 start_codon:yes stop_codon:yes gene_type:complete
MILKKVIIGIYLLAFLNGCAQNVALLGPAYTLASTGNIYQAGLSYGSDQAVTKITGKSTAANVKELIQPKSDDNKFEEIVKKRIRETRKKLNLTN